MSSVERGIFDSFFKQMELRTEETVEALFNEIFEDAFIENEDEMLTEDLFMQAVSEKLGQDTHLKSELSQAFQKAQYSSANPSSYKITVEGVKAILTRILKKEMLNFANQVDEHASPSSNHHHTHSSILVSYATQEKTSYSSEIISQILSEYRKNFTPGQA